MYYQLYYLKSQLSRYNSFQGQVQKLISSVEPSIDNLDKAVISIEKDFQFNENSADNGDIKKYRRKVDEVISYLKMSIVPEIKRKISSLEREIAQVEYEIELEEERRRQEASQ